MVDVTTFKVDNKVLKLTASVKDLSYFTNVVINKVIIYNQDGYSSNSANATALLTITVNNRSIDRTITEAELGENVADNLFIAKIITSGTPSSDTPCGMDIDTILVATFDPCSITKSILNSVSELESECVIPKNFIDLLLGYKAIQLACETGNINKAIALYKSIIVRERNTSHIVSRCRCNG